MVHAATDEDKDRKTRVAVEDADTLRYVASIIPARSETFPREAIKLVQTICEVLL